MPHSKHSPLVAESGVQNHSSPPC